MEKQSATSESNDSKNIRRPQLWRSTCIKCDRRCSQCVAAVLHIQKHGACVHASVCVWDPYPIEACSLGTVSTATEKRALRRAFTAAVCRAFLSGCWVGSHSVYFQQGRLIRASSCQRFVSVPLLSPSRPSPWGVRGIRQMNTFKSNSTQTDNSPTAMPPAPLGRDMVVLCLISPTPGAQYRGWPRLWMWRQRSSHSPLETTCKLRLCKGEEQGRAYAMFTTKGRANDFWPNLKHY